jgi:hypothetical protein
MMIKHTRWNGTQAELLVLVDVLKRHCTCQVGAEELFCPSHELLVDQRAVDGLLFGRSIVERLIMEEFAGAAPAKS